MVIVNTEQYARLKADYESVAQEPWRYFFCPILYVDERTDLCQAHVINQAFSGTDKAMTIQRADVDSRFGSLFERDFVARGEVEGLTPEEVVADKKLASVFNPTFLMDGVPIGHYIARGDIPDHHTQVELEVNGEPIRLVLKIHPDEMRRSSDRHLEIAVERNVALPSMVSILKAVHLTLFHLIGYRYALSEGGRFLGKDLLGNYYCKVKDLDRPAALTRAEEYFRPFTNMVQLVLSESTDLLGTVTDGCLNLCVDGGATWAYQVFVRAGPHMFIVMLPVFETPQSTFLFRRFLQSPATVIQYYPARFRSGRIERGTNLATMAWPKWDL